MEFPSHGRLFEIEEGTQFMPFFDAAGLNREALARTLETGLAHYYSRAQRALWKKGEQSGQAQVVKRILVEDDQDCLLMVWFCRA